MFYYYGAKHRFAKRYPFPEHKLIIEPFAGSAGYSMFHLERDPTTRAILIEKDPRVVELWNRILDMSPSDIDNYPIPTVGQRTTDYFIMTTAASNALAKCKTFKVTPRVVREFERLKRRVKRISQAVRGRVEIVEGDFSQAPDVEATWFIDPPYQVPQDYAGKAANPAGMGYAKGCDASCLDYQALGDWCSSRKGQVIVCEYATAEWLPFSELHSVQNSSGKKFPEGIWLNNA